MNLFGSDCCEELRWRKLTLEHHRCTRNERCRMRDKRAVDVMHGQHAHHPCRLVDAMPSINHLAIDEEILLKQNNALGLARCTAGIHNQTIVPSHVQAVVWPWCWLTRSNCAIEFWIIYYDDKGIRTSWSYSVFIDVSRCLATLLTQHGVERGHRVAIASLEGYKVNLSIYAYQLYLSKLVVVSVVVSYLVDVPP